MGAWWWSYVLDVVGLVSLYFLGRAMAIGWIIGACSMILWTIYAIQTHQWGFLPGCAIYAYLDIKGFRKWRTLKITEIDNVYDSSGTHL